MGNNTADTQWPSATVVTEDKKELLDRYFSLLDINEPTSGEKIAQLYTEDGWLLGPAGLVKGREGMLKVRNASCTEMEGPYRSLDDVNAGRLADRTPL